MEQAMSIGTSYLPEFDQEMAGTRKVLEQLVDDKLDWKAHPKSNSMRWVASHLVEIPGWLPGIFQSESWDIHPPGEEPYNTPQLASRQEILDTFDRNVAEARKVLEAATDESFGQGWSLLMGGETVLAMPRIGMLRTFVLNHSIHHRAFLCSYLRLNDLPVPGLYGPSGDENG